MLLQFLCEDDGAMTRQRKVIHCRVSPEAHDAWRTFTDRYGVSLTALLEAIAHEMVQLLESGDMEPVEEAIIADARRIDQERRRRS